MSSCCGSRIALIQGLHHEQWPTGQEIKIMVDKAKAVDYEKVKNYQTTRKASTA